MTDDQDVPELNLSAYQILYSLEVGMREFIIDRLSAAFGPRWWKQLPPDVLKTCNEGRAYERTIAWARLIPHHPMYYVAFPDLKKVLEKTDNWRGAFGFELGRRDIIVATLSEVEPVRNAIAHNRLVSAADVSIVEGSYLKIAAAIGPERFAAYLATGASRADVLSVLAQLQHDLRTTYQACSACRELAEPPAWTAARAAWWFDPEYLGAPVDAVLGYFGAIEAYRRLPRHRGTGHQIEAWVQSVRLDTLQQQAAAQLAAMLAENRWA